MTKRLLSTLAAGVAVACWSLAGALPLAAQVADAPGVTVNLGGANLVHRPPVAYPPSARENHIEGTLQIEAKLDSTGAVSDARVISGPDELRRLALQSVLQWHFARSESGATRQIMITFRLPDETNKPTAPVTVAAPPVVVAPSPAAEQIKALNEQLAALMTQARNSGPIGSLADLDKATGGQFSALQARIAALQKISAIKTFGLSDQARGELLDSLPVHAGDAPTKENMAKLTAAVKAFDEHLNVTYSGGADTMEVRIVAPGNEPGMTIRVGGNVQAANILKKVQPVYPPDAKAARVQGAVTLDVLIGKDGTVQRIAVSSGPPQLVPSAIEAVKQWTYRPTLLNGAPVEVNTQIMVNYTLAP